jgi:hypothetical protein
LGEQRARFGKAGVTSTGTPLACHGRVCWSRWNWPVNDELYKADMERSSFYRKAEVEKWQAGYSADRQSRRRLQLCQQHIPS